MTAGAVDGERRVYLEPSWQLPASYDELLANPPEGYRFLVRREPLAGTIRRAGERPWVRHTLIPRLQEAGVPLHLLKSMADRLRPPVDGVVLTHAVNHVVLRREPWLLDLNCELPAILAGPERRFDWFRGPIGRALKSPYCRRIFTWLEAGRRSLLSAFGEELADKTDVVYWTVPAKRFAKNSGNGRVKLLFVGSVNFAGQFSLKGGKEAVEAYALLRRRSDNVEMVVRSDLPDGLRRRYEGIPGLRIVSEKVAWEELEREYQNADIFVQPGHVTPAMVYLEAMSYELPVVTTDVWGNPEIVQDGKTGFLVPASSLAPDFEGDRLYARSRHFDGAVRSVDPRMVASLVEKLSLLVEDGDLRRRLGRAGRREIEEGRFSTARRNARLRRVLDEATGDGR